MSESSVKNGLAAEAGVARVKMLIGGRWRSGTNERDVVDPYRGERVACAPESTLQDLDDALSAAVAAKPRAAAMPGYERAALLRKVAALLVERAEGIAQLMSRETGKAIKDSRAEVIRSQDTILLSAEEAIRIEGEQVPLDGTPMGAGKLAFLLRFPVGVVAGITPFNAPFNLACHKIGPALAAGNAIVLKAPPQAPLSVSKLLELFDDAGAPAGFVNLLFGNAVGPALVRDPRVDFVSFTGSSRVGAEIKAASGLRRVALELGGNGTTIVHADASVDEAAPLCARNSMRLAGQSCISVQNVYVHESIYDRFVERLVQEVKPLRLGDPLDAATDVGTLIDAAAAKRVESWVGEAISKGASALTGARRHGAHTSRRCWSTWSHRCAWCARKSSAGGDGAALPRSPAAIRTDQRRAVWIALRNFHEIDSGGVRRNSRAARRRRDRQRHFHLAHRPARVWRHQIERHWARRASLRHARHDGGAAGAIQSVALAPKAHVAPSQVLADPGFQPEQELAASIA
jgi:acyl-CoA reductase-like NAD-dependent aldehyde dehydrogenase